ncbi:hypothetical protein ACOZ4L_10085 [Haloplanus ruber]|uniref:Transcriptional initiation protein Tat n=1 Tax=Haloplanus ruber TaxID=869892 RepID=A0ABD6CXE8_9EURY|nr:hypothetical protein [Haloplanus ruber]
MYTRRSTVAGLGVALLTGTAGCGALSSPEPVVVETEFEGGIDALFGESDVHVVVRNDGAAGDVEVTLELLDSEGTVLVDERQVASFEADEQKRVTFTVDVPEETDDVRAEASPA